MRSYLKTTIALALFLVLMGTFSLQAEVKLRIYLQDGTLQAGSMVADNPDHFVLLTKEGRIEVPKSKIMFINGKPLKYWEGRTDKTYSTEIIPSEIPNPAFVNEKASLPPPVKITESKPVTLPVKAQEESVAAKEPEKPAASAAAAAPSPTPTTAAVRPAPVVQPVAPLAIIPSEKPKEEPVVKEPIKKEERVARGPRKKKRVVKEVEPPVEASSDGPAVEEVRKLPAASASRRKGKFDREGMGDVHFQNAQEYMARGEKGQATQELHISVLLNRYNGEAQFQLGKLYFDQGQYARAEKFFNHPTLKKRAEARDYLAQITGKTKEAKRSKEILFAATFLGSLGWIPLVLVARRFRRSKVVISADELETPEASSAEEPAFVGVPERPVTAQMQEAIEDEPVPVRPVAPASEPMPILSIFTPREVMETAEPIESREPVYAQRLPPEVEAEAETRETAYYEEEASAAASSVRIGSTFSVRPNSQDILRDGRFIDKALQNGHAHAAEGKLDAALREYRTVLVLDPASVDAHLGVAYVYFAKGNMELAGEFYRRALDISPHSADAHYGLARVLLETGLVDEAVPELQATLSLDPNFDDARETLTALGKAA